MKRITVPAASAISLSTALRRPRTRRDTSRRRAAIRGQARRPCGRAASPGRRPRRSAGARPSTIAVLPTPGSPISTGLFLVPPGEDLDHAADRGVAADHGVELALCRLDGEVAAEALERLVALLGAAVGDAVGAAHVLRARRRAARASLPRRAARRRRGPGGRRSRAADARSRRKSSESARASPSAAFSTAASFGGDRRRFGDSALDDREALERTVQRLVDRARVGPSLRTSASAIPVRVGEQRRQRVGGRHLGIARALGKAHGLGEGLLARIVKAVSLHII